MRVLLLADDTIDALVFQRELIGGRHEIRVAATLGDALALLALQAWRPDVIITDLDLPDSAGTRTLEMLRSAAGDTPVVVGTVGVTDVLRAQLDAFGAAQVYDKDGGAGLLNAIIQQHQLFQQTIAAQRMELKADLDRVAREAAEAAVTRAVDRLIERLDLDDEEGLKMAVRLARGWEAAKIRFFSAIATGLGTALLVALGAGLVTMLRQNAAK